MNLEILIADDERLVRDGLRRVVEARSGWRVIGEAGDGAEAIDAARKAAPDVVLMDIAMPGVDGIEATRTLRSDPDAPPIVMVASAEGPARVRESLLAGAAGYVRKSDSELELLAAIEAVSTGGSYLPPGLANGSLDLEGYEPPETSPLAQLSQREREVLGWLAEGLSSREIGERLCVSPRTIDSHRVRLMRKLGIHRVQSLVRFAIREGLIEP